MLLKQLLDQQPRKKNLAHEHAGRDAGAGVCTDPTCNVGEILGVTFCHHKVKFLPGV
jgi:hypothetical protein